MKILEMKKTKKLLMTLVLLPLMALADTETVDGITWTYDSNGTRAVLGFNGVYRAVPSATVGAITIPSVLGGCPVTIIGNNAFKDCTGLTSVAIPSSVTDIMRGAFSGCTGLTSVTVPSGLTSIAMEAFYGCSGLRKFTIPSGVKSVGNSAFARSGLEEVAIPSGVTIIYPSAFSNCRGLMSVSIPPSVTSVGERLFENCTALKSVALSSGITKLEKRMFSGCSDLASMTIPTNVTSVGDYAFENCSHLTTVMIPSSVKALGQGAFEGCDGLSHLTIPSSVSSISSSAFRSCCALTEVVIPPGVETISYWAFGDCSRLKSVTIPLSVTSISGWAFKNCASLESVTIPISVNRIGDGAFEGCCSLESVLIPPSVTNIGNLAFSSCDALRTVYVNKGDAWRVKELLRLSGGLNVDSLTYAEVVDEEGESGGEVEGVQLWEGGPYWAECNVGASKPEEYGLYFWWGDTEGHTGGGSWFSEETCPTYGKSITELQSLGYVDSTGNLAPTHDAARVHLGDQWRMPTCAELDVLVSNCDTVWTTRNGVSGRLIKGRGAYSSKSIFLPAAGFGKDSGLYSLGLNGVCWSSTPNSDYSHTALSLYFASDDFRRYGNFARWSGRSVRPVREFATSIAFMIVFDANGGTCSTSSKSYVGGSTLGTLPTATRSGYAFDGWYTAASGGTKVTETTTVTGSMTLYARWKVVVDKGKVQNEWYLGLKSKKDLTLLSVGDERIWIEDVALPYLFSHSGAILHSTLDGYRLDLSGAVITGSHWSSGNRGIWADGDISIFLQGQNSITVDGSGKTGIYSQGNVLVFGDGALSIISAGGEHYGTGIGGSLDVTIGVGASVTITGAGKGIDTWYGDVLLSLCTIGIYGVDYGAIHSQKGNINILGSAVSLMAGDGLTVSKGVVIDGSIVDMMVSNAGVSTKSFSATHSYLSWVSTGDCALLSSYESFTSHKWETVFDNCVARFSSSKSESIYADILTIGEGDYVFATSMDSGSMPFASSRDEFWATAISATEVNVRGGNVSICAPGVKGVIAKDDFKMEHGRLEVVRSVDARSILLFDVALAATYGIASSEIDFSSWSANFYGQVVNDILTNARLASLEGETLAAVFAPCNYTQSGGTIWCDNAQFGVVATKPFVDGGSYKGAFYKADINTGDVVKIEPSPTDDSGTETGNLVCYTYIVAGKNKYDKVEQPWDDVLPSYYGTESLYADEGGKLYFWIPQGGGDVEDAETDLSPYAPSGWSGPLVLSKSANDFVGTTQFTCEDDVYVSFSAVNFGADLSSKYYVVIYLDGEIVDYQEGRALQNGYYEWWTDVIGTVGAGNHRMVMSVDDLGDVAETDEDNNLYFVDFSVVDNRAKVSFDPQGGVVDPASVVIRKGGTVGTLPTPTRSKYKFLGWYTAAEGGTKISSTTKVTADVTYYAHWQYDGQSRVDVKVSDDCMNMGAVSGGKTAKGGAKVTLKATAKKGYVFAGWYRDAAGENPVEGGADYRSPSYAYVAGEDDMTFYAKFIPVAEDWVSVWCQSDDEYARGVEIEPLAVAVGSASLATVKVTGLPTGLKFTAKPLTLKATNNRAEADLPVNTIYGTPTKSGIYSATITATTAGKKSETYKVHFVVRGDGEYLVDVMGLDGADYPDNGSDAQHAIQWGKMSGYGVFKPNTTATLKATANRGYVFAGWFSEVACVCEGGEEDDGCIYTPAEGSVDYRSTSFPVKVGYEDGLYYARFVRAEDDDMLWANVEDAYYLNGPWSLKLDIESVSLPTVTVKGLPSGLKFNSKTLTISGTPAKPGTYPITLSLKNATIKTARTQGFTLYVANIESPYLSGVDYTKDAYVYRVGTSMEFDIGSCATGGYAVTGVSGLPSGLKFSKNSGLITGVPTKAGPKTVTITLKNGNLTSAATITLNVDTIDTWAYGTFNGGGEDGVLTLTVGNTGKISGKWMTVDGTWTLSAKSYESYDEDEQGRYRSLVAAKCGTQTAHFWLDVCGGQADIYEYLSSLCGYGPLVAKAKRNVWKDDQRKDLAIQMMGASFALTDEVSLKVGSFGAVTATGKFVTGRNANGKDIVYSASCSTVLVPVEADVFKLYLCFPKKDGKFDGMTLQEVLEWDGSELAIGCAACRVGF